jgi:cyclic-di-GMP-binding protein
MEITTGPLGLSIPVQSPNAVTTVKFTPSDILSWRNALEIADLSVTTKRLYQVMREGGEAVIAPKDRLEILELLRPTVQFICQSLSKHYTNQAHALKQEQFVIANLSQTLQSSMAYGYKTIIEQTAATGASADLKASLLPIAIQRVFYYFSQILLRSYKIYSKPPSDLWRELHLIYKYVRDNLPHRDDLIDEYKRILLFSGAHPTKLRQNEQEALYRGTETWASLATLGKKLPNTTGVGYLIVDTEADQPPYHPSRGQVVFSDSCEVLYVLAIANRLKNLIPLVEPNELQSRMSHYNQAEYAVPLTVLRHLLKIWGMPIPRVTERVSQDQPAQICIGLRAIHFHANHDQLFQMPKTAPATEEAAAPSSAPAPWVAELEKTDELGTHIDFSVVSSTVPVESTELYTFYPCTIVNETSTGYSLVLAGAIFSVLQAGEVLGLTRADQAPDSIEICGVRWLQYESDALRLGVERLSSVTKAAALQLIKNKKAVGDYVRCLLLESSLLVPTLPFKTGDRVHLLESELEEPKEYLLSELLDATGGYKRFQFVHKKTSPDNHASPNKVAVPKPASNPVQAAVPAASATDKKDPFDDIWSHL